MAILRAVLPGTRVAEVRDVKLPEVMAVEEMASDAVTEPAIVTAVALSSVFERGLIGFPEEEEIFVIKV